MSDSIELRAQLRYMQILLQNMETRLKACEISLEMHAREIESYKQTATPMARAVYQNYRGLQDSESGPPTIQS